LKRFGANQPVPGWRQNHQACLNQEGVCRLSPLVSGIVVLPDLLLLPSWSLAVSRFTPALSLLVLHYCFLAVAFQALPVSTALDLPGAADSSPQADFRIRACRSDTGLALESPHTTSNVSRTGLQPTLTTACFFVLLSVSCYWLVVAGFISNLLLLPPRLKATEIVILHYPDTVLL
jgi:hypothetical protein